MSNCPICLDIYKSPVSLPCGHVFCQQCIVLTVQSPNAACSTHRNCPTCRRPFPIASLDPQFIPAHLRPFLLPAVRRLYIDTPAASPSPSTLASSSSPKRSTSSPTPSFRALHVRDLDAVGELVRLRAQNAALLSSCTEWRHRAETYAATRVGLATFARIARNYAYDIHAKEKETREKYESLKRKYEPDDDEREGKILCPRNNAATKSQSEDHTFGVEGERSGVQQGFAASTLRSTLTAPLVGGVEGCTLLTAPNGFGLDYRPIKRCKTSNAPNTLQSASSA